MHLHLEKELRTEGGSVAFASLTPIAHPEVCFGRIFNTTTPLPP